MLPGGSLSKRRVDHFPSGAPRLTCPNGQLAVNITRSSARTRTRGAHDSTTRSSRRLSMQARSSGCQLWRSSRRRRSPVRTDRAEGRLALVQTIPRSDRQRTAPQGLPRSAGGSIGAISLQRLPRELSSAAYRGATDGFCWQPGASDVSLGGPLLRTRRRRASAGDKLSAR
jgi:hypothetical protein